jgi:hypothetical protein
MPDEHSPVRHTLALRRIDPEQNLSRFYTLVIERDLFGQVVLVRPWGRIGGGGDLSDLSSGKDEGSPNRRHLGLSLAGAA